MARDITVFFDDGTSHVYRNAPDDVTPEQVTARAQSEFTGKTVNHLDGGRGETVDSGIPQRKKETTANPFMGMAARGAKLGGNLLEGFGRVAEKAGDVVSEAAPALDRKLIIDKEGIRLSEPPTPEEVKGKRQLDSSDLFPVFKWADSLKKWGADINYQPSTQLKDLGDNPAKVVPFIVERVISSAPDMIAAAGVPEVYLASLTNETLNERLKNDGKSLEDATVADVAAAAGGAAVQTFLEKFATGRLLKPGAVEGATTAVRVAKEAGVQAGTEATEEVGGYAAETVGTKKGFDPEEAALIAAEAALVGGALGAGVQGVGEYGRARSERARAEADKVITDTAQTRLQEIESKPEATQEEKDEAEFIKNNLGNPDELATRYAPKTTTEEKPVTGEEAVVTPPAEIKSAEDLINAPPKVSAEYASDELRSEASNMDDDAAYEEIDKIEQLRDQLANLLFDPAQLEAQASLGKVSVEDLTTRLTQQFDELATRLDVFHKDFMGRMEPTVQAPVQQRVFTPQELTAANISPDLVKALNLRVEETPPVQPPVTPVETTQEVPGGTEPVSPPITEQAQPEPVGGGVELPPQGQPAEGRVASQVEGERLEPTAGTVSDVNAGEAVSEPPLTEKPEEILAAEQLLEAVDKGGMILNPAKVNSIARNLGLEVASDAKPVDTIERIRQAVDRANSQQTATAQPTAVPGGPAPTTVAGMNAQMLGTINGVGAAVTNLPKPTSELYARVRGFLGSTVPDNLRQAFYAFTSLPQQVETFAKELPTLRELLNVLNVRASELKARREVLDRNVRKWTAAIGKHEKFKEEFYKIAHESTRLQVEFNKNPNHPLTRQFNRLPADLQKVYWEMLASYRDMSAEYIRVLSKNMSPSQIKKLQRDMAKKRLRVYLPLYRQGNYWLRYQVPTPTGQETVVRAFNSNYERELAWKEARASGAVPNSNQNFSRIEDLFASKGVGTFFNRALEELDQRGASMATKRALYELYLDQIPAASVRQQYRKRDGYLGYDTDLINVYATVGSRMANQLTNLEFIPEIDKVYDDIQQEARLYEASGQANNLAVDSLMKNLTKQLDFIRDPSNGWLTNKLSTFSYYWYILGNVSTAIVNTTQLPMVVYPMLAGKYNADKAAAAMADANRVYFNGGWDNDNIPGGVKRFPSDYSFGVTQSPSSPLGKLYRAAVRQSALRRSTGYDLTEGRKKTFGKGDYVGMLAKSEQIAGWLFQNSERYNREITLIAAFNLEMEKNGGNVDAAIKTAIDLVTQTHGTTLAETSPRAFQTGFGKIAFTFKNFAQTQIYLQSKLLRDAVAGESPEIKKLAAKQLVGIMAMSWAFAGLHGMPFYSAVTLLADLTRDIWGDDDDPTKADEFVRQATNELAWKGMVNQLFMADVASRTGFNGLLWRDDDKRLEEVGTILFAMEQVFGPSYAAFMNVGRGVGDFKDGHYDRALEAMIPSALRNGLKSYRYATKGATTRDGEKIYDNFNAYELFLQTIGFTPTEVSERSELAGAAAKKKSDIADRKTALLNRLYLARISKDKEGIRQAREAIKKFNQNEFVRKSRNVIGYDDMEKSYQTRRRNARNSVYGISVPKTAAPAFKKEYKKEEDR